MLNNTPTHRKFIISSLLLFWALVVPFSVQAAEPNNPQPQNTSNKSAWSAPIRLFQKTISRADGSRCAMYPSCSRYALDAFNQHSFLTAWMLTSDRLLRCGHNEIRLAPRIVDRGTLKAHDPLSANTFWWDKP